MATAHKPAPRAAFLAACRQLASASHRRIPHPRPIYNQFLGLQCLVGMGVSAWGKHGSGWGLMRHSMESGGAGWPVGTVCPWLDS
jgi:hypothetical protein